MKNYRFRINGTIVEIRATSYIEALSLADSIQDGGTETFTSHAEVTAAWRTAS